MLIALQGKINNQKGGNTKEKERLRHDTACEIQGVQSLWPCGLLLPSIAT